MSFSTVFVHAPGGGAPYEVARDARDPFDKQKEIEQLADVYSSRDRLIQVYAIGQYVKPWRKNEPIYESYNGKPTAEFRTVSA